MDASDKKSLTVGLTLAAALASIWFFALAHTPTDAHMGDVYRVIYVHVPAAITSFVLAYVLLGTSLMSLAKKRPEMLFWGRAAAEVGLLFTVLTLVTGSLWGYPTWGVWWTWDARITTTFLLALLYAGYLVLYQALPPERRGTACSVLGIMIALDVPIIYKSVTWWRTLHQPPSIVREGGSTMDPVMLGTLLAAFVGLVVFALWLLQQRATNLRLSNELDHWYQQEMK